MDPTLRYCQRRSPFSSLVLPDQPSWYGALRDDTPTSGSTNHLYARRSITWELDAVPGVWAQITGTTPPTAESSGPSEATTLAELAERYPLDTRRLVNPFPGLSKAPFTTLLYANLDALFQFSGLPQPSLYPQDDDQLALLEFSRSGGSGSQYFGYRFPNTQCYGVGPETTWDQDKLPQWRLLDEHAGGWARYLPLLTETQPLGVDLVVSDDDHPTLGFEPAWAAVQALAPGGHLIMPWPASDDGRAAYALSGAFQKIVLYRPATVEAASSQRYLLGWARRGTKYHADAQRTLSYPQAPISVAVPADFQQWWTTQNQRLLEQQRLEYAALSGGGGPLRANVTPELAYNLWNIAHLP
jgi:hypothetical protein